MDDSRIAGIIASKRDCYFISPHYDDMAYSASMLAKVLSKTNKVIVVNVFTQAGERPYTRAAKRWMQRCGYEDAIEFFADRNAEDKIALSGIANQVIDLGFADAPWRKKAGYMSKVLAKMYPELANIRWSVAYKYFSSRGKIAKADRRTFDRLKQKLLEVVDDSDAAIFCPLGVGGHFDHLLVRDAIDAVYDKPIYWDDYPYILAGSTADTRQMRTFECADNMKFKQGIIAAYKSQYLAMFGDSTPEIVPEHFYYTTKAHHE